MKSSCSETNCPNIIADKLLKRTMEQEILPFLSSIGESGYVAAVDPADGAGRKPSSAATAGRLYYEVYTPDSPRGAIVISHGYSESILKYKEVIYYFVRAGYQVYLADHRGHGRSLRETEHPNMIHITRFMDYVNDLHSFITKVVKPSTGSNLPLYLYAHSMGGAIGALYLETWPDTFQKAVLTAPMLGISMGAFPAPCARALGRIMISQGKGASYAPGQHPYRSGEPFEESCSACRERFDLYHEMREADPLLQACGSSYSWAYESLNACRAITQKRNCQKITVPVLVFQSMNDSTVKASGIARFVKNTPSAHLIQVTGSKHEIYNSTADVLKEYYRHIFEFFASR